MSEKEGPNWSRIAGNAGVAFFTTMIGVSLVGVPPEQAWAAALIPALFQAGLSACRELQLVGKEVGEKLAKVMLF
jgi:hypothetical protein